MEALAVSICSEPGKYLALSKETILGMEALEPSEGASCPNGPGGSPLLVRSYHKDTSRPLVDTEGRGQVQVAQKCALGREPRRNTFFFHGV